MLSVEIITSELNCYINVYSMTTSQNSTSFPHGHMLPPPPPSSEWSGWTFLVCAVNRNCAFIIHIMNHVRKRGAQCWDWSLCVCEGKSGGYEAPRQKREILCHHSTWGLFFFSSARRLHLSRPPFMSPLATCSRNSWTFSETFQRPASFSLPPSLSLAPSTLFHNWKETKETLLL